MQPGIGTQAKLVRSGSSLVSLVQSGEAMLNRLYIDNIHCLVNFEFTPQRVAVLVGSNGGGKSTVLQVLTYLSRLLQAGAEVEECFPLGSATRWEQRQSQRVELDVTGPDGRPYHYSLEVRHEPRDRRVFIADEHLSSNGQLLYELKDGEVRLFDDDPNPEPRASFPVDPRRSFLHVLQPRPDNQRITAFKMWISQIWFFSLHPNLVEPVSHQEDSALWINGSNFVAWYRTLLQEAPQVGELVKNDVQAVMPGLSAVRLERLGVESKLLRFDFEKQSADYSLRIDELSDGQRILFVLYTILRALADKAMLIAFDEPDNFVALAEIQPWLAQLRETVLEVGKGTLLVASHHPEVIDYLAADQAMVFWRDHGGPSRIRQLKVDREKGLTASEWVLLEGPDGG
jgi:predicted ATPase